MDYLYFMCAWSHMNKDSSAMNAGQEAHFPGSWDCARNIMNEENSLSCKHLRIFSHLGSNQFQFTLE